MKLLVCGGREYQDKDRLYEVLDGFARAQRLELDPVRLLIHGDSRGADKLADGWAVSRHIQPVSCRAIWEPDGVFNPRAGLERNAAMLWLTPDCVIAFPGGRGTAHMVRISNEAKAKGARIRVIVIST